MGLKIEKAICLCLDKRKEHWEGLENQCVLKGIPFEKFMVGKGEIFPKDQYDYIDDSDPNMTAWAYGHPDNGTVVNHYNAFVSHQRIVQRAKDQKLENFLLLEDDAYFTDRYDFVMNTIDHHFEGPDAIKWDMLYLGWWIGHEDDEWNTEAENAYSEHQFTAMARLFTSTGGMHGVIIRNTAYDALLSLNPVGPIDMQLNLLYHHGPVAFQSYVVIPKVIHDKGIFSECDQNPCPRMKI